MLQLRIGVARAWAFKTEFISNSVSRSSSWNNRYRMHSSQASAGTQSTVLHCAAASGSYISPSLRRRWNRGEVGEVGFCCRGGGFVTFWCHLRFLWWVGECVGGARGWGASRRRHGEMNAVVDGMAGRKSWALSVSYHLPSSLLEWCGRSRSVKHM